MNQDQKIAAIQKSTRTLIKGFIPVHNSLRMRMGWYYKWHLFPLVTLIHWLIVTLALGGTTFFSFNYLNSTRASNPPIITQSTSISNPNQETQPATNSAITPVATPASIPTPDINISTRSLEERLDTLIQQNRDRPTETPPASISTQVMEGKLDTLITQISQLATNEVVANLQSQLGPLTLLSSEATQTQIKNKIETNLAKDDSLLALIDQVENDSSQNKEQLTELATTLSRISTEATLTIMSDAIADLSNNISNLIIETTGQTDQLHQDNQSNQDSLTAINDKLESDLAKNTTLQTMSDIIKSNLEEINNKLANQLNVSVANWLTAIGVTNFPTDYPSSSAERSQEQINSQYFQRNEDFSQWAIRQGYGKKVFSGEIANPTKNETNLLSLSVPANHTYYLTGLTISSTNSNQSIIVKNIYTPTGGADQYIDRLVLDKKISFYLPFSTPKKLAAGDSYRLVLQGVSSSAGDSTASFNYLDLPWSE